MYTQFDLAMSFHIAWEIIQFLYLVVHPKNPSINGNSRILKWRYCTIEGHILWGYSLT